MAGLTQTHPTGDRTGEPGEGEEATGLVRLEGGTHFLDSSRDVLNEQLAKVVEGLEFPGLQRMIQNWGYRVCLRPPQWSTVYSQMVLSLEVGRCP